MALFKNAHDSHQHSLNFLSLIYGYDSFLDGITAVADMGCGTGMDANWWANLETREDPPEPRNLLVYAVDKNIRQIESDILTNDRIFPIEGDFEVRLLPRNVDIIYAHDSFQYARDPIGCLKTWRSSMNVNGMLMMALPQATYTLNNKLTFEQHNWHWFNHNILSLIYMLAASGFDCRDAYFYRENNTPWLYIAVYAADVVIPENPSWYNLADLNLLNDSMIKSLNKYGHVRLENLVFQWLDRNFYQISN
jgi:SAM-dependent methyltransferase